VTAIDLIAAALPPETPPEEPKPGLCCVTGAECATIARKHVVKPSFTNLDLLRAPQSDRAGVAAWRVLNHAPARQSLWWCDGHDLRLLKRVDVRALVLNGVTAPQWSGYATTSYKKHGALRAPVNSGPRQLWLFEMLVVDCSDRGQVAEMWERLRAAQDAGIPRPLIEALDVAPGYIAKIGWRVWRDFETWARSRMKSPLYQFLTYLLPSQEELKAK
jgi:hypothetical protein